MTTNVTSICIQHMHPTNQTYQSPEPTKVIKFLLLIFLGIKCKCKIVLKQWLIHFLLNTCDFKLSVTML